MKKSLLFLFTLSIFIFLACPIVDETEPGKILWTHECPDDSVYIISQTIGADLGIRMALGEDGSIYYAAGGGTVTWVPTIVYAINKDDGSLKWRSQKIDASGLASHITVGDDGAVLVNGYMKLYSFNPNDGSTNWTWEAPEKIGQSPTKYPLGSISILNNGDILTTAQIGGVVYCIDPVSGTKKWHNIDPQGAPSQMTIGRNGNIYSYKYLYAPNWDGGLYLVSTDPNTGLKNWIKKINRINSSANNILVDHGGNLICNFAEEGTFDIKFHVVDASSGNILSSSSFVGSGQGSYLGPDESIYQNLSIPGEQTGIYRINPDFSSYQLLSQGFSISGIDSKNRFFRNFVDTSDNKTYLGAFFMDNVLDWQCEEAVAVDDRNMCISDDNVVYVRGDGNTIMAIQSDAPLATSCWPKIASDNRNTFNINKN